MADQDDIWGGCPRPREVLASDEVNLDLHIGVRVHTTMEVLINTETLNGTSVPLKEING